MAIEHHLMMAATRWRRTTLPFAWAVLRARAELVALNDRVLCLREGGRQ